MKRILEWLQKDMAALIYTPVNRRYLTHFESSLGLLYITRDDAVLMVDGRYYLDAKRMVKNCRVELIERMSEQLKQLVRKSGVTTVVTENTITVAELNNFEKTLDGIKILADGVLSDYLADLRSVKSKYETDCIIKAQRIAEKSFAEVLDIIKPGISERTLAVELEYRMKKYGSEKESFDTIVVSGKKSAVPHGTPDEKCVADGEFITFDFGAVFDGYHSDMTRTVAVGYATDEMERVYNTVLSANLAAEKAVFAGVKTAAVDAAARIIINDAGYGSYFNHSTGHSLGLEIHEFPSISPGNDSLLKKNQIITDEPGIYLGGKFGVRIEDMLLVTGNGCKNLTGFQKKLIIIH